MYLTFSHSDWIYESSECVSDIKSGAEQELALKCRNEQEQINAQISKIEQSVDTLSSIAMNKLDFSKFKSSAVYVKQHTDSIMSDVVKFGEHTDGAICVYVRYNPDFTEPTSGIFLTRNSTDEEFTSSVPTDFTMYDKTDVEHVGWYYVPVENGAPLWMDPYLNGNVNVYMISYVVPLYVDGESVGIIGMDIDFSQITGMVEKQRHFLPDIPSFISRMAPLCTIPRWKTARILSSLG